DEGVVEPLVGGHTRVNKGRQRGSNAEARGAKKVLIRRARRGVGIEPLHNRRRGGAAAVVCEECIEAPLSIGDGRPELCSWVSVDEGPSYGCVRKKPRMHRGGAEPEG